MLNLCRRTVLSFSERCRYYGKIRTLLLVVLTTLFCVFSDPAWAVTATFVPGPAEVQGLTWNTRQVPLELHDINTREQIFARVQGHFSRDGWTLVVGTKAITPDSSGNFDFRVPIQNPVTEVVVYAVNDYGASEETRFSIHLAAGDLALIRSHLRWLLSAGVGLTSINYQQTNMPTVSQLTTALKFSAFHGITKDRRWSAGILTYADLLPLSDNQGSNLKFFGLNARVDYAMPGIRDPWVFDLAAGWYYVTTFGTSSIGFENMSGPELYPSARYYFRNENFISAFAKYSPVLSGAQILPFQSRELATGLGYGLPLKNQHSITFTIDYASLDLQLANGTSETRSITLGVSYTL